VRDSLTRRFHVPTLEDQRNALIGTLDKELNVTVEKEGVVRIAIDWRDAQLANAIVQAAVRNFINNRHDTEEAAIKEAITILQGAAASLQTDVDGTIAQLHEEQLKRSPSLTAAVARRGPVAMTRGVPSPSPVIASNAVEEPVIGP